MIIVEEFLKKLMTIPSITGEEEEVCNFLYEFLTNEGFKVEKQLVIDRRFNIVATLSDKPNLFLQAHLDTVSPYIEFRQDKENIYGRGACDAKGSGAAMITSAISAKNKGYKNFGLIFTVGEEEILDGAKKLVKEKSDLPFVVVGEPTNLKIVNEHFGLLVIKIIAKGKAAHSSRPEEGENAIETLLEFIRKVKNINIHPNTLISLNKIQGGVADNIIPENAKATYSFRVSPEDTNSYFEEFSKLSSDKVKMEKIIDVGSVSSEIPPELDFIKERMSVKYFTELSMFGNGAVIGPGDIKFAHGPDERISKKELREAVEIYSKIIEKFN